MVTNIHSDFASIVARATILFEAVDQEAANSGQCKAIHSSFQVMCACKASRTDVSTTNAQWHRRQHRVEKPPYPGYFLALLNTNERYCRRLRLISSPAPHCLQTPAFDVFSGVRNITVMGIMLSVGVVLIMTGIWVALKIAGKCLKTAGIVEEKIVVHYIETGEVSGACTPSVHHQTE